MRRLGESGIHELFIPGLEQGDIYKYEIKIKGNTVVLKRATLMEHTAKNVRQRLRSSMISVIMSGMIPTGWALRDSSNVKDRPMLIYEVHLGGFRKPGIDAEAVSTVTGNWPR